MLYQGKSADHWSAEGLLELRARPDAGAKEILQQEGKKKTSTEAKRSAGYVERLGTWPTGHPRKRCWRNDPRACILQRAPLGDIVVLGEIAFIEFVIRVSNSFELPQPGVGFRSGVSGQAPQVRLQ